jgi:DNA mismatch repair protein MutS2
MTGFEGALPKLEFEKLQHRIARYAISEPGRELLTHLRILTSLRDIRRELTRVSECKALLEEEGDLPLEAIYPVRTSLQKSAIEGTTLLPKELLQIGATLRTGRVMRTFLAKRKDAVPLIWESAETLHADKVLEFNIEQAIDETGAVRATASKELQAIRRAIGDRYDGLRKRLESILRQVTDLGFSQEEIITTREGRMVIPVKTEHKNRVPGFIHSASSSGATVFIEPAETLELNNEIRSLHFEEQREIDRILKSLTLQVGAARDRLLLNLEVLADLDALVAKAKYSIEILGTSPEMSESGPLRLLRARHPLLMMSHGRASTVPLDIELGGDVTTFIISGPNAGGKSVAMKCVGICALMAQAGLHIPAEEGSVLPVFRSMFVEIGDEQSIENDLSTFSSHLANLKEIAEGADGESLVLIDEIGAGTDPAEGSAIASAILSTLTDRKAYTIVTTHQGTLKVFAHETPGIANAAMEFDRDTLTPTYRLKLGVPGSSYALEMAERLGFQQALLQRARATLGHQQDRLERLIADLEATALQHRRELESISTERVRLQELVAEYEGKVSKLSAELRIMKQNAVEEASRIIAKANTVIESLVKEIRETSADRDSIKMAREKIEAVKLEIADLVEDSPSVDEPGAVVLEKGSHVSLAGGSDVGEIFDLGADGSSAIVVFGSVKMKVRTSDLRPARTASAPPSMLQEPIHREGPTPTKVDVRGMTGDEALPIVDKFLDDAFLAGFMRVEVIHGKGTGALRKKVGEFLATHPRVKSFRLGQWNEGGDGATIVELNER